MQVNIPHNKVIHCCWKSECIIVCISVHVSSYYVHILTGL